MFKKKINKKTITLLVSFFAALVIVMMAVISLATEGRNDKQETIEKLSEQVSELENNLSYYKALHQNMGLDKSYGLFEQKAFQLRYPTFAETLKIVYNKSKEYGFNPFLIMAIIQVESSFNPTAVSNAGAYGLMQVNYKIWKDELNIDFSRIFDKEYNIELGLKILKHYYERANGNLFSALSRYCTGYTSNYPRYKRKIANSDFYTESR